MAAASLVYDTAAGVLGAASLAAADLNLLESLLDDRMESFLYGFPAGTRWRFLGARFRVDDNGATANYEDPWCDIYEMRGAWQPLAARLPGKSYSASKAELIG